jgi:predicted nucleic acid-binding protein
MGLILDSSVVIAGERKGQSAAELLADLRVAFGAEAIAFATVSVIKLEHGIWRAKDAVQAERRQTGVAVPLQHLVIGVTALEFDYAIATHNVQHFQMIPNLLVKQF